MMYSEYVLQYILYGIFCYLLCNFNFAIFFTKRIKHVDIRTQGSGNPGTTNVVRVFGLRMGTLTFLSDLSKGLLCAGLGLLLFRAYTDLNIAWLASYIGGFFAGLGHVFPLFYKFNGGKGFAAGVGFFLIVNPLYSLVFLAIGTVILLLTDRMSIFAILFFTAQLIQQGIKYLPKMYVTFIFVAAYFVLIVFAHRHNLVRLFTNKENALGIHKLIFKKK